MARALYRDRKSPTVDPKGRCGTYAGYKAHQRRGEIPCDDCRAANSEQTRQRRAGEKVTKSPAAKPRRLATPIECSIERMSEPKMESKTEIKAVKPSKPAKPGAKPQVPEGIPTPPDWLKASGLELWIEVNQERKLNPAARVLLTEACRTVDRLERLSAALSSRSTLWFELGDIDQATELGIPIVVNGMIGEARQLQSALRQTLNALKVVEVTAAEKEKKSPLDELAARRRDRLKAQGGA